MARTLTAVISIHCGSAAKTIEGPPSSSLRQLLWGAVNGPSLKLRIIKLKINTEQLAVATANQTLESWLKTALGQAQPLQPSVPRSVPRPDRAHMQQFDVWLKHKHKAEERWRREELNLSRGRSWTQTKIRTDACNTNWANRDNWGGRRGRFESEFYCTSMYSISAALNQWMNTQWIKPANGCLNGCSSLVLGQYFTLIFT